MLRLGDRAFDRKWQVNSKSRRERSVSFVLEDHIYQEQQRNLSNYVQNWNFTRESPANSNPAKLLKAPQAGTSTQPQEDGVVRSAPAKDLDKTSSSNSRFSLPFKLEHKYFNHSSHRKSKSLPGRPNFCDKLRLSLAWRIPTMNFEWGEQLLGDCDFAGELHVRSPSPRCPVSLDSHEEVGDDSGDMPRVVDNRISLQNIGVEPRYRSTCTLGELYEKYKSGFSGRLSRLFCHLWTFIGHWNQSLDDLLLARVDLADI